MSEKSQNGRSRKLSHSFQIRSLFEDGILEWWRVRNCGKKRDRERRWSQVWGANHPLSPWGPQEAWFPRDILHGTSCIGAKMKSMWYYAETSSSHGILSSRSPLRQVAAHNMSKSLSTDSKVWIEASEYPSTVCEQRPSWFLDYWSMSQVSASTRSLQEMKPSLVNLTNAGHVWTSRDCGHRVYTR